MLRLELQGYALGIAWVSWSVLSGCRSRASTRRHAGSRWSTTFPKPAQVFLLADHAATGRTMMAGLLIPELELRGLADRIPLVGPSSFAFQWQRKLQQKFPRPGGVVHKVLGLRDLLTCRSSRPVS